MSNKVMSFAKGLGAGMIAGAAAVVVGKMIVNEKKNGQKGSAQLAKAVGEFVDGVQTMIN